MQETGWCSICHCKIYLWLVLSSNSQLSLSDKVKDHSPRQRLAPSRAFSAVDTMLPKTYSRLRPML